jgi:hypothetical protein
MSIVFYILYLSILGYEEENEKGLAWTSSWSALLHRSSMTEAASSRVREKGKKVPNMCLSTIENEKYLASASY